MAKNILVLGVNDINVSLSENMNKIKINMEDGNQIWMSIDVARKLLSTLDGKLAQVDMEFE